MVYNPSGEFKIIAVDCGMKYNQIRCLIARGAAVKVVPWNYDFNNDVEKGGNQSWLIKGWWILCVFALLFIFLLTCEMWLGIVTDSVLVSWTWIECCSVLLLIIIWLDISECDGVFVSNGPGDPTFTTETIKNIKTFIERASPKPLFGICFGHQLLALAAGCTSFKMK